MMNLSTLYQKLHQPTGQIKPIFVVSIPKLPGATFTQCPPMPAEGVEYGDSFPVGITRKRDSRIMDADGHGRVQVVHY